MIVELVDVLSEQHLLELLYIVLKYSPLTIMFRQLRAQTTRLVLCIEPFARDSKAD